MVDSKYVDEMVKIQLQKSHLSEYDIIRILKVEEEFEKLKAEAISLNKKLLEFLENKIPNDYNYSFDHAKGTADLLQMKVQELNREVNFAVKHYKLREQFQKLQEKKN